MKNYPTDFRGFVRCVAKAEKCLIPEGADGYQEAQQQIAVLEAERDGLRAKLDALTGSFDEAELEAGRAELQKGLEQYNAAMAQLDAAKAEMDKAKAQLDDARKELNKGWREYYEAVKDMPGKAIRWKFEIEHNGRHIGWVSSYMIDEHFEWIAFDSIREGQTVHRAIGIDICEPDAWNKGIGTNALRAFIQYNFRNGFDTLYTQTWSGNTRMVRCTQKLGFAECGRRPGLREVGGKKYDALTFRLEKSK